MPFANVQKPLPLSIKVTGELNVQPPLPVLMPDPFFIAVTVPVNVVPEKEILGVKEGQVVGMALNAQKDVVFKGSIRQINPAVDPKTGTVKVTVEITKAPSVVRPGSFVDVKLETQRHDKALLVPKKALLEEAGERFVFVINKDKASRRTISVGFLDDQNAEILSGVNPGETVVTSGQGSLREGSKTEIVAKR